MSKLTQLPNGSWIDLRTVIGVQALPLHKFEVTGTVHANRVVVSCVEGGSTNYQIIDCESWQDAEQMRDRLAAEVNAAHQ